MQEPNFSVANTIIAQMGGYGRLSAMIGAKHFTRSDNSVRFIWPAADRKKPNGLSITLTPADTYNLTWYRFGTRRGAPYCDQLGIVNDVYCDQLISIFEQKTGLYLSL